MPGKAAHADRLRGMRAWRPYLVANSGLPGPRGNIELAQAVADLGTPELFQEYLAVDAEPAAPDHEKEYLVFCGVLGLGRLAAEGAKGRLADMLLLLQAVGTWARGSRLEQRAAAAGLCEPVLLGDPAQVGEVLEVLDGITAGMAGAVDRSTEEFRALRKGMGYCWSVAVAALPREWKKRMERWLSSTDPDVAWVMKENMKKNRLVKMDPVWVRLWRP